MRIWILQGVAFARNIVIRTEQKTVHWEEVQEWIGYYRAQAADDRNTFVEQRVDLSISKTSVMDAWSAQIQESLFYLPLTVLLYQSQYCGATEAKDKVFALCPFHLTWTNPSKLITLGPRPKYAPTLPAKSFFRTIHSIYFDVSAPIAGARTPKRYHPGCLICLV